jgi:hypothetical protein
VWTSPSPVPGCLGNDRRRSSAVRRGSAGGESRRERFDASPDRRESLGIFHHAPRARQFTVEIVAVVETLTQNGLAHATHTCQPHHACASIDREVSATSVSVLYAGMIAFSDTKHDREYVWILSSCSSIWLGGGVIGGAIVPRSRVGHRIPSSYGPGSHERVQ